MHWAVCLALAIMLGEVTGVMLLLHSQRCRTINVPGECRAGHCMRQLDGLCHLLSPADQLLSRCSCAREPHFSSQHGPWCRLVARSAVALLSSMLVLAVPAAVFWSHQCSPAVLLFLGVLAWALHCSVEGCMRPCAGRTASSTL